MKTVTIVCDGSSLGNGQQETRAGAVAALRYVSSRGNTGHKVVGEYLGSATNNQAEIVAAAIGLETLKEPCDVSLYTDSQYVVQTQLGNYRQKTNREFWERLRKAADRHRVKWFWTRGHANDPVQEEVDRAARRIASAGGAEAAILDRALEKIHKAEWPEAVR
jgi:ribonuclease HI